MELLRQGLDINSAAGRHYTLLQAASVRDHESIVKQPLDSGAVVNIEGDRYGNALSAAASSGNVKVVQAMLEESPHMNAVAAEYGTTLQAAAQVSPENEELTIPLLAANADASTEEGLFDNALQVSAFMGNKNILIPLIDAGAKVDVLGGMVGSALQAAASQGHSEIVTILLGKGVNSHMEGGDCDLVVWIAVFGGYTNIVRYLIPLDLAPPNHSQSHAGEALEFSEELERRIEDTIKAGINISRCYGAVDQGDVITVQEMLAKGVDVNVRGGEYSSAWQTAALVGHTEAMSLSGRTALWSAAGEGHVPIVRQLLGSSLIDKNVHSVSGRNYSSGLVLEDL